MMSESLLRAVAERATRHLVFWRRLPPPYSECRIRVSPSNGLRFLLKPMAAVDPTLFALVEELVTPGAVVWDIGANQGLFALAAAHQAGRDGRIVAVEADTWLVGLLRHSAATQPSTSAPIQVIPAAIAEHVGLRAFCLARRTRATNYLADYGTSQTGGEREQQTVVTVSLDFLLEQGTAPDVVKIDVEGAEVEVLKGARRLLDERKPVIVCEVSSTNAQTVAALLRRSGYELFDADVAAARRVPLSAAAWNTVAIPQGTRRT